MPKISNPMVKEGDWNAKFFYAQASHRRRNNQIIGLEDDFGNWLDDIISVERYACDYFKDLFSRLTLLVLICTPFSAMSLRECLGPKIPSFCPNS